jgi:hypothetical protein
MILKSLMIAAIVALTSTAFAQQSPRNPNPSTQSQPQTPANDKTNAQGEVPSNARTMQEKDTGLMNQSGGAPGATGSTGTQSGTPPTGATPNAATPNAATK